MRRQPSLRSDKFASGGGPPLNIYLPEDSGVTPYCVPSKFTLKVEAYKAAVEYLDLDEVGYLKLDGSGSLTASEAAIALDAWGIDESCEEEFVKACALHGDKKITATELKDIFVRVGRHKRSLTSAEQLFLLFDSPQCCKIAHKLSVFILGCIFLTTLIMILESMPGYKIQRCAGCEPETQVPMFTQLETFAIVVFTLEYGLKFASSPFVDKLKINQFYNKYPQPYQTTYDLDAHGLRKYSMLEHARSRLGVLGRVYRFVVAPMHMVDLVAIAPWYLERILSGGGALVVLRIVRLARITRLFKAARGSAKMLIFINTLQESAGIIGLLATGVVLIGLVFGTLLAATEQGTWFSPDEQIPGSLDEMDIAAASAEFVNSSWPQGVYLRPDVLGNALEKTPFQSIMHASWCVITTITTVGYGDMYPTTTAGKWVCSGAMFVGLIVLALPITVLGGNFAKQVELHVASMRTQNLTLATAYIDYLKREVNSHHINSPENTRLKERIKLAEAKLSKAKKTHEADIVHHTGSHSEDDMTLMGTVRAMKMQMQRMEDQQTKMDSSMEQMLRMQAHILARLDQGASFQGAPGDPQGQPKPKPGGGMDGLTAVPGMLAGLMAAQQRPGAPSLPAEAAQDRANWTPGGTANLGSGSGTLGSGTLGNGVAGITHTERFLI